VRLPPPAGPVPAVPVPRAGAADARVTWTSNRPVDVLATLGRLGHGPGDPLHRVDGAGAIWRTTRTAGGPATYRLTQLSRDTVRCDAWGAGADDVEADLPALLGEADDATGFDPVLPAIAEAHRRHPGLRIPRSTRVLETLIAAVIEQRVVTLDAHASWRRLVRRAGDPAPGPAPEGMRLPPTAAQWLAVPSWDWHRAGVDARRARAAIACAQVAGRVEQTAQLPLAAAYARLLAIPGVGAWTAAEVAQRAWGDADAVSVGDYHLASMVGWTLLGRPIDDDEMLEVLARWRPHRYRLIRLLDLSGAWVQPRFGPRAPRATAYRI
jgi:3-methyladenine DNA glycosylase/8-oxoguanine DNA glycosylase